jgi:tetratricopeptide (TPR) repeat protein
MAERFLYIPAMAFAAGLVWLAMKLPQRAGYALLGLITLLYAARTWNRNRDWNSDLTLGESAVRQSPDSYKSHKLLANALFEKDGPTPRVLQEAEKSLSILDPLPPARRNADTYRRAASWYIAKGDRASLQRALDLLQQTRIVLQAQAVDPSAPADVDRLVGEVQMRMGNSGAALEASSRAAQADPGNAEAWRQYSDTLGASGRVDDAVIALMEGVLLTTDTGLRQRIVELYRQGAGGSCALLPGQNGTPAMNPACPQVHTHLCSAAARAIALRMEGGRNDLADQLRTSALNQFGCEASSLKPK